MNHLRSDSRVRDAIILAVEDASERALAMKLARNMTILDFCDKDMKFWNSNGLKVGTILCLLHQAKIETTKNRFLEVPQKLKIA
jgi:hypothetical protein